MKRQGMQVSVNATASEGAVRAAFEHSSKATAPRPHRGGCLQLSCIALAVAGLMPGASQADTTYVSDQTTLNTALAAADPTIALSGNISLTPISTLTSASVATTIDTAGYTITGGAIWSGPLTFSGTLVGVAASGSTSGAAIQLNGVSVTTNAVNNGVWIGGAAGGGSPGGAGVVLNSGQLVNNGTITGGAGTGTLAGGIGVIGARGATLTNNGLIQGGDAVNAAGGSAISVTANAITVINNGTIRGGSDLSGVNASGVAMVFRAAGSMVINTGTIVAGNGVRAITSQSALTIVNSGLISGGSGQDYAISTNGIGATNGLSLELQAGSTIVGIVQASAGASNNTLTLGGAGTSSFDVSSIGSAAQYRNFNLFTKTGTGTWSLIGTGTTSTPWTISAGTLQIGNGGTTGSVIGDITNNATLAFNRSDTFTFDNNILGTGVVNQVGSGTTVLTTAQTYTGDTNVLAGTLAVGDAAHTTASLASTQVNVAAGGTLAGYGTVLGTVTNSGTVAVGSAASAFASSGTGTLNIGGDLINSGTVNLAAASGVIGNTLNVAGNYTGVNGTVALNAVLNEGGAISQADQLIIAGNASGTTALKINGTGAGVLTVGDGIQVVTVNGTSAANSFRLATGVQAGAYEYLLYQGSSASANDWYLRSYLLSSSAGSSTTADAPVAYRPGVVGYAVTPQLNTNYGYDIIGRLNERMRDIANPGVDPAHGDSAWGRIGGGNLDAQASDRFAAVNARTFFAQVGRDFTLARDDDGASTHAGAMLTFGSSSSSFSDSARSVIGSTNTGSVQMQAQSAGGYWTRYAADGSYFDGVGQLTHYQNRYTDIYGVGGSQNGVGAGVSGEVGKRIALGSNGVAIEPQAQLLYQYVHLNGLNDGVSAIGANTTNALRGRIGFRLLRSGLSNDLKTSTITPYLTANVLHDFFAPGQTTVAGMAFPTQLGKTWYDVGVGLTGSFGKSSEVYASVKYEHNLGGESRRNVSGQVGYRFSW